LIDQRAEDWPTMMKPTMVLSWKLKKTGPSGWEHVFVLHRELMSYRQDSQVPKAHLKKDLHL